MNKVYIKIIFVISLFLLFSSIYASSEQHKINSLQNKILESNNKLTSVEQDIKNIDQQISKKILLLEEINTELNKLDSQKIQLAQQKQQNIEILAKHKKLLIKQLETTYVINKNSSLYKLSNINNLQQLNRFLHYLESYNNFNKTNINKIKSSLKSIGKLDANLTLLNSQQLQNKQKVSKSYEELKLLKSNNINLKDKLQSSLKTELSRLDYYQKQYNKLSAALNNQQHDNAQDVEDAQNVHSNIATGLFKNTKGRLALPVPGIVDINFQNNIKSKNTIFIKTAEGNKVKAIFSGTVVFSNWLRGFGFLTIIDHGHGYMSLYGNNQTLLKSTGAVVTTGETIALTGSSGGVATPGLYFEIRHNGSPVNTIAWLRGDIGRDVG